MGHSKVIEENIKKINKISCTQYGLIILAKNGRKNKAVLSKV
jgi:hypothetical protein